MIPSDWLETFAVFAEEESLSRAARRMHLSQPAVHAQLRRLQELVGVALYRRVGRGLALTREGVELAAFARSTNEAHADVVARLRGEGAAAERRLVIAAGAGAIVHVIPNGLTEFLRGWRGRLEMVTCDAKRAAELVLRGEAHVGVAAFDPDDEPLDPALLVARIADVDQVLVVPRAHPIAKKRAVGITDLAGERFVAPPSGRPQRARLEAAFRKHGVALDVSATAIGWDVTLRLVELGLGLGIVNASIEAPRALVKVTLRGVPRVRYVAFMRRDARQDAKDVVASLRAAS
jgi:LysR family transcriptional regulator, low CO2-responsive transcriptional regulator